MIINKEKYMIVTKDFPLLFHLGYGTMASVSNFDNVEFTDTKRESEEILNTFDEPENYTIVKVDITYKF